MLLSTVACGPRTATIRVTIPDLAGVETPLAGIVVNFLPYDRDSILAQLESQAEPRPHTRELDSLFRAFRQPFVEYFRLASAADRARRARDSLIATLPPETARENPSVKLLADSVERLANQSVAARVALDRARAELWPRIEEYRRAVRQWEDSTFRDYSRSVRSRAVFANPVADTTDELGWATITLTDGAWWATTRSIDPGDPNAEWYWNIRIEGDTVLLDPRTGRRRPRY
jgi:hypothetical protein